MKAQLVETMVKSLEEKHENELVEVVRLDELQKLRRHEAFLESKRKIQNGNILLPVIHNNNIIAKVAWTGNLYSYDDGDTIIGGQGLVQIGNHIVLTVLHESGGGTAKVISETEAIKEIFVWKAYHLLEELNLLDRVKDLVG